MIIITRKRTEYWILAALSAVVIGVISCSGTTLGKTAQPVEVQEVRPDYEQVEADLETAFQEERYPDALEKVGTLLAREPENPEYHLIKGQIIAKLKGDQKALDYLTERIAELPEVYGLYAARGNLLLRMGFVESAKKDFTTAYDNGYKTLEVIEILLSVETESRNFEKALTLAKEALALNPEDSELWYSRARLEIRLGRIDEAEDASYQSIQWNKEDSRYFQLYYEILSYVKNDQAFKFIKDLYAAHPVDSWIASRYATELTARGRIDEARDALNAVVKTQPHEAQLLFQLASIHAQDQNWTQAISLFNDGLKIQPENTPARIELAKAYFQVKENQNAFDQLNLARKNDTKEPFVYETLAKFFNQQNDTFEAERIIFEGLEINPKNYNLILEYARILEKRSDFREAIKAYEEVLKAHPDEPNILGKLGHLNRLARDYTKATDYFERAINVRPDVPWIRSYYTELLVDQEKWDQALAEVSTILKLTPDDYWALAQKAQIEFQLEDYVAAFDSIVASIEKRPELTQLKRIKGEILEALGRDEESEAAFRVVLNDIPDNTYVLTKLAYIQLRLGKRDEALANISQALDSDDFDIATLELYLYLTGASEDVWNAADNPEDYQLYKSLITRDLNDGKRLVNEATIESNPQLPYLRLLARSLGVAGIRKDNSLDSLEKVPNLTYWNYLYMGIFSSVEGDYESAVVTFQEGLRLAPGNIWLKIKLAYAYQQLERHKEAVACLNDYLDQTPFRQSLWARLRLALNYDLSKQYRSAEKVYQEILEIDPEESLALNNLAWMYLTTGDPAMNKKMAALELALKAVEVNATPANLDTLAEAYFQNAEYHKALKTIERALDKDRNDIDDFKKTQKKILKALETQQD